MKRPSLLFWIPVVVSLSIAAYCQTNRPAPPTFAAPSGVHVVRVYYAHCTALYDTAQEKRDVATLRAMGFDVANPNSPECEAGYKKDGMPFFKKFAVECDFIAFRALPDGAISAGVAAEIGYFKEANKPIVELPSNISRRILTVDQTRDYIKEVGKK